MPEPAFGGPSRREFLRASGGAMGWTVLASRFPGAARAAGEARRIAAGTLPPTLVFFTPAEAAEIEAISAFIIPTDETPGAREAGAVYFIDRALDDFLAPLADGFRAGLRDFGERMTRAYPDTASIGDLDPSDAMAFLKSVEDTRFFGLCRTFTVWGTFADPMHGGNRDQAGWKIIGFEDRHAWHPPFGYYDADAHGEAG